MGCVELQQKLVDISAPQHNVTLVCMDRKVILLSDMEEVTVSPDVFCFLYLCK